MSQGSDLRLLTLDFETYWDADFTLKKVPTQQYILDPRFEAILVSMQDVSAGSPPVWAPKPAISSVLNSVDWSRTAVICHNARFDVGILTWRYGHIPAFIFDTMAMAQPTIYPVTGSVSLDAVARYLGLGAKGDYVQSTKGRPYDAFTQSELRAFAEYSMLDTDLTTRAFQRLRQVFPPSEAMVVDTAVRMFTEPQFVWDPTLLAQHLAETRANLAQLMDVAGLENRSQVLSDDQFAHILRELGVEPARKSGKAGEIYAFAKTDRFMKDLLEHDDDHVRHLAAARLGLKSTIEVTRSERLLALAQIDWDAATGGVCRGKSHAPIPLKYYAAHPGRFGGADKQNMQNLRRPDPNNPKAATLRRSLRAPRGHVIVKADASQIECRFTAWLAKEGRLLDLFRSGGDPYVDFATRFYKRPITKADKLERHLGKTAILGLGYGMGRDKFIFTCANAKPPLIIDLATSAQVVDLYRGTFPMIGNLWNSCGNLLPAIAGGFKITLGPVETGPAGIRLPNGMWISYVGLQREGREWTCRYGNETKRLFGPKVTENIVQALARIQMTDAMNQMREWGFRAGHTNHDELVFSVEAGAEAQECLEACCEALSTPPWWAPDAPLAAEGGIGPNWGECK